MCFLAENSSEGPFWLCWVLQDAPKPKTKGINVSWLKTFEPGDEHHIKVILAALAQLF